MTTKLVGVQMRIDEGQLARIDQAAAEWTLDELSWAERPTRHTRSSVVREAVDYYLNLKERPRT